MQYILIHDYGQKFIRWVPRLLTSDNKRNRETISQLCSALFKTNPKEFLYCFVTVANPWIHWYTRQTKEQSKQSKQLGQFDAELWRMRPILAKKKVLFRFDNAPAHTYAVARRTLVDVGYELLPHLPDPTNLAPCDSFLLKYLRIYDSTWISNLKIL